LAKFIAISGFTAVRGGEKKTPTAAKNSVAKRY